MLKNTSDTYGSGARFFHWVMGLIIIGSITVGFIMTGMKDGDDKWFFYGQHKSFGLIILSLIPLRLLWRAFNAQPTLPASMPWWQTKAANLNILFLYACMILMPTSGFVMSIWGGHPIAFFNLFTIAASPEKHPIAGIAYKLHGIFGWGIALAIGMHILASFYHHFVLKDNVLKRMLGCSKCS
jgi:cytochrome b561